MALNIPDYSRYAQSQRAQLSGQLVMPIVMALFAFTGIAVTSVTVVVDGKALWNPVDLLLTFPTPVVLIGGIIVILSSITINVGANVMAPARAFENLWPRVITFAIGAVLTGLLSLLMQPWYVLSAFSTYIFTWLGSYGTLLGPFDGIAIADYWLVRSLRLDLVALYRSSGRYAYSGGANLRAVAALAAGWILPLIGLFYAPLHVLWQGGWFFGFGGRPRRLRPVHAERSLENQRRRVRRDHRVVAGSAMMPRLTLRTEVVAVSAIATSSSERRMSIALVTPASPPAPSP